MVLGSILFAGQNQGGQNSASCSGVQRHKGLPFLKISLLKNWRDGTEPAVDNLDAEKSESGKFAQVQKPTQIRPGPG